MPPKSPARLLVERQFRQLARQHQGTVLFEMDQMEFQQYWKIDASGMCNGISILWLRHQHNEIQAQAFEKVLKVRYEQLARRVETEWRRAQQYLQASQDKRLRDFSEKERQIFKTLEHIYSEERRREHVRAQDTFFKVLEKMHTEGQINPIMDDQPAEWRRVNSILRAYGMEYSGSKTFAGGWGHGHTDLGKYVTKKGTASLLHTNRHAMAACNVLGYAAFFDSNLGAVSFKSGQNMGRFLSAFFKIQLINRIYSGNSNQEKLSVRADCYNYTKDRVFDLTGR